MSGGLDLQALADKQAIADVIYRYCRAMDRIDAELGYTVWHADGQADYGEEVYQGSGRGFIDFVCAQHRKTITHVHQVTNVLIEVDGDQAGSEAYVVSDLRFMHGHQLKQVTTWGRYVDQWSRREGRWAIDKRLAIRDFSEVRDASAMTLPERGRRDRTDPSYAILKGPQ